VVGHLGEGLPFVDSEPPNDDDVFDESTGASANRSDREMN